MTLYDVDYGYDCNGNAITVTSESRCSTCDSVIIRNLSDGTSFSISCKCKYLWDVDFILTTYSSYGEETLVIKGYGEAMKKYENLIESGQVCTLSQILRSNI